MESVMKGDVKRALKTSSDSSESVPKTSTPKSKLDSSSKYSDTSADDAEGEDVGILPY